MKTHVTTLFFNFITRRVAKTYARCWLIKTSNGETYGYTSHTRDIIYGGILYSATLGLQMSDLRSITGTVPDSTSVSAFLSVVGEELIVSGIFDNAYMEIFVVNYHDMDMDRVIEKVGYFGEISRAEGLFSAELRGLTQILDAKIGRLFSASCDAVLGDYRCQVPIFPTSQFLGTGTVTNVLSKRSFSISVANANGFLNQGSIRFTDGLNCGFSRDIRSQEGAFIVTYLPFPRAISNGDGIEFIAGCDKTSQTCISKFHNKINFRGFDHVPTNEDVFSSPLTTKVTSH